LKEWTTPDSRNTPSTTDLEEEETVGAPGNDGNASMPEHVKRPNPWTKMMMIMMIYFPTYNIHNSKILHIYRNIYYTYDETLEQVSQFTYLGSSISHQFFNDVECNLAKKFYN